MSNIFVTSDEHYGHQRIVELAHRPFTSVAEMNEALIAGHNSVVPDSKGFLTVHVGDWFWQTMALDEALAILARLHGRHAFIYGNHDELIEANERLFKTRLDFVIGTNKASGTKLLRHNKHKLTLNHYAQRVWDGSHKGHWHVYGHSHGQLPGLGLSFDIGVDTNGFKPYNLDEIEAKMSLLTQHHTIDNTGGGAGVDVVNEKIEKMSSPRFNEGSTVHAPNCNCGWCNMGLTS